MFSSSALPRLLALCLSLGLVGSACGAERPRLGEAVASQEGGGGEEADSTTSAPIDGVDTIRVAIGADWTGNLADASPASASHRVVAGLLHEGLTTYASDGSVVGGLAQRWFVSDDRLQWTFVLPTTLTDGAGRPLTAHDVKASLEALAGRGVDDPMVAALWPIVGWMPLARGESGGAAGLVAFDDTTLVVLLAVPYEPLPDLLASPTYGVTGTTESGEIRTTGAYRYTDDPGLLEAVDPDAPIRHVELVRSDGDGAALLAAGRVDWAVVDAAVGGFDDLPGDVVRHPLDVRVGIAVRYEDTAVRAAILAALDPTLLVSAVANATLDVSSPIEADPAGLPSGVMVYVPVGPLESLAVGVAEQLETAGVSAAVVVLGAAAFADAVVAGEAGLFPMVSVGGTRAYSSGASLVVPDGIGDVFGLSSLERTDLVAAALAEPDPASRGLLVAALRERLLAERLLLPVATFEVLVGLGPHMGPLATLPDGTLDFSGFGS